MIKLIDQYWLKITIIVKLFSMIGLLLNAVTTSRCFINKLEFAEFEHNIMINKNRSL
jgi:hypothetical protein